MSEIEKQSDAEETVEKKCQPSNGINGRNYLTATGQIS
jgi:hypothetical protein